MQLVLAKVPVDLAVHAGDPAVAGIEPELHGVEAGYAMSLDQAMRHIGRDHWSLSKPT